MLSLTALSTPHPGALEQRWETDLKVASGLRIPVEVTYQPLRTDLHTLEVYAIRDLRERRGAVAQIESFNARLQRQHELLKEQVDVRGALQAYRHLTEMAAGLVAAGGVLVQAISAPVSWSWLGW